MSVDVSVVIAHRGNPLGLWATIHSIEAELENKDIGYEYCIVCNGDEKLTPDVTALLHFLKQTGRLKFLHKQQGPMAPPLARQLAIPHCTGKYLCFFDNHCLVAPGYFTRALRSLDKYGMDMLHSTYRYYTGEKTHYEYRLTLDSNFWGRAKHSPADPEEPYRIAAGGHGGFFCRRDVWNEVGGYWDGFDGYGGEEMYFDLKMWLLGHDNWIDPKVIHYHFAGARGYDRHYTDQFYRNMMSVAYMIGGSDWLYKVMESFDTKFPKPARNQPMYELMMQAEDRARPHAEWLRSKATMSLDTLLTWFSENNVSF